MLVHRSEDQSRQEKRRLSVRWVVIFALACLVFGTTMREGVGMAVTATAAAVALLHALLE